MIIGGIKVQKLSYNDTQHFFRGCRLQLNHKRSNEIKTKQ